VINAAQVRLAALEQQLREIVPTWTMAPVVAAYQALRGVSFLVAIIFVAEVGDVRRFATPQQLMAFLGLVPSERTTADTVRRGAITKTGNHRARRVLIEGAWTYRFRARVSENLAGSTQGSSPHHPQHCLESTSPAVRPLPSAHCQWQEDPCCDHGDCSRARCLPVGDRSAGCAPKQSEPAPIMTNKLSLGALLSPSIPRAKRRDPGGRWGLTAQRGPSRSMLPCDECKRLASSPYGEAHISGYRVTLKEDRRPTHRQT
jgi:hypothetical protein